MSTNAGRAEVFRREVAERVVPLLLVKQFAFDLELLAVARALGYDRVRELPVRLEYRFTGSGVRSRAVVRALWDTAAVFYRLRILRTYQRKRDLLGFWSPPPDELPLVTLIGDPSRPAPSTIPGWKSCRRRARPKLRRVEQRTPCRACTRGATGVELGERDSSVHRARRYGRDRRADARAGLLVPDRASGSGDSRVATRRRVTAVPILPGNVRVVSDYPAESCLIRRRDYLAARAEGIDAEHLVSWLSERDRRTVYTPDTSIAVSPPPFCDPTSEAPFAMPGHAAPPRVAPMAGV